MPEHIEIIGPNGSGKTYFGRQILLERVAARGSHAVLIATKPDDDTLPMMGWPIIHRWPPDYKDHQAIFWVPANGVDDAAVDKQREQVKALLSRIFKKDAHIIVVFDEVAYVCIDLRLNTTVAKFYREGRALGITCVAYTQRVPGVTRYVHSESYWTAAFRPKDEEDAERVAQVLGSKKMYMPILMGLNAERHELLLVHNLTGEKVVTWIDPKSRIPVRKKRG